MDTTSGDDDSRHESENTEVSWNGGGDAKEASQGHLHKVRDDVNGMIRDKLNACQLLARKEGAYHANERKAMLREKLVEGRKELENVRENGRDPLLVFPEEIWTMILENVTDLKDIASWAESNQLFEKILMTTKEEFLFGKILPFVLKFLGKKDLLSCRFACKQWCAGVDSCLENARIIDNLQCLSDTPITDTHIHSLCNKQENSEIFSYFVSRYRFSVPNTFDDYCDGDELEYEMSKHPRNPFIGRSIAIVAKCPWDDELDYREEVDEDYVLHMLERFLGNHGQHIWQLKFKSSVLSNFEPCRDHFRACAKILGKCPSLRTLCLKGKSQYQWSNRRELELDHLVRLLPDHEHLEFLEIEKSYMYAFKIQDKLLQKYSSQLKHLSVHLWSGSLYQNLSWENLKELQINSGISSEMVDSLIQMNAPKLQKLGLCLEGNKESSEMLDQLMRVVSSFVNVNSLFLKFWDGFMGFSNKEIISLPAGREFCRRIKTIEIDIRYVGRLLSNFLIIFPLLENLIIWLLDEEIVFDSEDTKDPVETHLFPFTKYFLEITDPKRTQQQKRRAMYDSTVWDALSSLQVLEVRYLEYDNDKSQLVDKKQVYTRQGYTREKMDRITILNAHMTCAHREADVQNEDRNTLLRQQLRFQRMELEDGEALDAESVFPTKLWTRIFEHLTDSNDLENCSKSSELLASILEKTKAQWLFEKILPMVLTKLDKSDILSCRQVCKKWCTGVDGVLESCYVSKGWKRYQNLEPFVGSYIPVTFNRFIYFFSATIPTYSSEKDSIRVPMSLHPKNPCVGRTVGLHLMMHHQNIYQVDMFVKLFGNHIWHFIFGSGMERTVLVKVRDYCHILQTILTNCPNLRTLHLSKVDILLCQKRIQFQFLDRDFPFPTLPHLENLRVDTHSGIGWILYPLLERHSGQLKCFNTRRWNRYDYAKMRWDNLEELHVNEPDSNKLLLSLTRISAPNLARLYINLEREGGAESQLKLLILGTRNFPKLTELHLTIGDAFDGFSSEEAMDMPPGFISPALLTSLDVITRGELSLSFDFLIFFPHLKRLRIREAHELEEGEGTEEELYSEGSENLDTENGVHLDSDDEDGGQLDSDSKDGDKLNCEGEDNVNLDSDSEDGDKLNAEGEDNVNLDSDDDDDVNLLDSDDDDDVNLLDSDDEDGMSLDSDDEGDVNLDSDDEDGIKFDSEDQDGEILDSDDCADESYSEDANVGFGSYNDKTKQEREEEHQLKDHGGSVNDKNDDDGLKENENITGLRIGKETNHKMDYSTTIRDLEPKEITRNNSNTDFVKLPEHFWERVPEDEEMYKLNIWQVLRSLQILEFYKSGKNIPDKVKVYTREAYDKSV